MRETALLHIKFALCATRGSFSSLFIRYYTQQRQQAIRRREIRNNRARLLPPRELQVHGHLLLPLLLLLCRRRAAVAAADADADAVTLEIRDSQDRRNIADRKPRRRGVLDNAAPAPPFPPPHFRESARLL